MFTMLIVLVSCVNMLMFPNQNWTQNTDETESNIFSEMKNETKYFGGQTKSCFTSGDHDVVNKAPSIWMVAQEKNTVVHRKKWRCMRWTTWMRESFR